MKGARKKRVAVLRGGPGEYHASLKSGAHAIKHLRDRHDVVDVLIDRDGVWHVSGLPTSPRVALETCDVAFNCLHGEYGEDGTLPGLIVEHMRKHTGSGRLASNLAYNKRLAKERLSQSGLRVPDGVCVDNSMDPYAVASELFNTLGGQYVVKPMRGSLSRGVRIVRSQGDLAPAIISGLFEDGELMIEQLIHGKEIKVGIVDGLRGDRHYTLLPIEIVKQVKTDPYIPIGGNKFIIPSRMSDQEKRVLMETALEAYETLGLRGYGMVDMILTMRGPVVLEVDTHPTLGDDEPIIAGLAALGVQPAEFYDHIIYTAQ